MKFNVKDCKFSEGMEKALNENVASYEINSLQFNYKEKTMEKSESFKLWNVPLIPILAVLCVFSIAAIAAVVVILFKKKEINHEEEEENNEA